LTPRGSSLTQALATASPVEPSLTPAIATVRYRFVCPEFRTNLGQQLAIVGSAPELGGWSHTRALRMTWSSGHRWAAEADIAQRPSSRPAEYKLVLLDGDGACTWEPTANRKLPPAAVGRTTTQVELLCLWGIPTAADTGSDAGRGGSGPAQREGAASSQLAACRIVVPAAGSLACLGPHQRLVLTGSLPQLGSWKPEAAPRLEMLGGPAPGAAAGADHAGGLWEADVQLPVGKMVLTKVRQGVKTELLQTAFLAATKRMGAVHFLSGMECC
jgi:hypothetical protein